MSSQKFVCPCCGHRTLTEKPPGTYNICQVCFWEDDPIQFKIPIMKAEQIRFHYDKVKRTFKNMALVTWMQLKW